jgi:hypothetical protein
MGQNNTTGHRVLTVEKLIEFLELQDPTFPVNIRLEESLEDESVVSYCVGATFAECTIDSDDGACVTIVSL